MNLGMPEMIFIFLLALIIFGPRKLPEIGRQLGKAMGEFKRASNDFKIQIEDEIRQIEYAEQQKKIAPAADAPHFDAAIESYGAPEGTVAWDAESHATVEADVHVAHPVAGDSFAAAATQSHDAGAFPADTHPPQGPNSIAPAQGTDV